MPKRKTLSSESSESSKSSKSSKLNEFAELYGLSLYRVAYLWTYNDGSDGCWPPSRRVYTSSGGTWRVILQSVSDQQSATLIFQRVDAKSITGKMYVEDVERIHSVILESFEDAVQTAGGKWFEPLSEVERKDVHRILNITKPLELTADKKSLKLSFEFAGLHSNNMQQYWYPKQLGELVSAVDHFGDEDKCPALPFQHAMRSSEEEMTSWMQDLPSFCQHAL